MVYGKCDVDVNDCRRHKNCCEYFS